MIGCCLSFTDGLISTIDLDTSTVSPKFLSRGQLYKAIIGDTIILPCRVQNLGKNNFVFRFSDGEIFKHQNYLSVYDNICRFMELLFFFLKGSFVLLWRRGSSVLTAGPLMITRDIRFKLVDENNLQISGVRMQDAGDYMCQIGDQETRDQVHTLEILGEF